jgi:hypothetical protein
MPTLTRRQLKVVSEVINRPPPPPPLVVAYGLGVNSTAMLVEMHNRGVKPDLILFADVGGEKPATYAYLPVFQDWLKAVGFPPVITVRRGKGTKTPYTTLEGQCLYHGTLPSIAFRANKTCSIKWKREPQDRYVAAWGLARATWDRGRRILKAIGFDAGPSDGRRLRASTLCEKGQGGCGHEWSPERGAGGTVLDCPECGRAVRELYDYWYPLAEDWGLDRDGCKRVIRAAGLPVPPKSACVFCPASKPWEIDWLADHHPDLLERALAIEAAAFPKLRGVKGLGGHSFSWTGHVEFRRDQQVWAADEEGCHECSGCGG